MEWLLPANGKKYNHIKAFRDKGFIDWRQRNNFSINDIVYIYATKPIGKIMFRTIVTKIDMNFEDIENDKDYWKDFNSYEKGKSGKFARLLLLEELDDERLSLKQLVNNGLKSAPQTAMKIKPNLSRYLKGIFSDTDEFVQDDSILTEGHGKRVVVNKYERNAQARNLCIKYHGSTCTVCGFDFYKVYGDIGKDFIHVHHKIPISQMKSSYEIDYKNDLVPVCPNCHAMLHRKRGKDNFYTVSELREIMNNKNSIDNENQGA